MAVYPPATIRAVSDALLSLGYEGTFDYDTFRRTIGHFTFKEDEPVASFTRRFNKLLDPLGFVVRLQFASKVKPNGAPVYDIILLKSRPWEIVESTIYNLLLSWNEQAGGTGIGVRSMGDTGVNFQLGVVHITKITVVDDEVLIRPGLIRTEALLKFGLEPAPRPLKELMEQETSARNTMVAIKRKPMRIPIADPKLIHKIVEEVIEIVGWHATTDEERDKAVAFLRKLDHEYHQAPI